jgi:hypothetical protein
MTPSCCQKEPESIFGFVVSKSMSQLADVRSVSRPAAGAVTAAAWPPDPREACASSEAVLPEAAVAKQQRPLAPPGALLPQSFDDYDADLELAWLGSILAICQPPPANNGVFSRVFSPLHPGDSGIKFLIFVQIFHTAVIQTSRQKQSGFFSNISHQRII